MIFELAMRRTVLFLCLFLLQVLCHAGGGERYKDAVFAQFTRDSVQYCAVDGHCLLMDIYQPVGDTSALRPLVIFAHGGSFMKNNRRSEVEECGPALCRELAKRGYVAVSIDYRLTSLLGMVTKPLAYKEIIRSVAEGRASILWFLKDIAHGNTYRIDKNRIFFAGNSAGAILAEQLVFIDSATKCRPALTKAIHKLLPDSLALPAHTLRGVISLAGAVLDTSIIAGQNLPALLHMQGDADRIVPYGYAKALYGLAPFKMGGLGASRYRYISQHIDFTEVVIKGGGHTPWNYHKEAFDAMLQQVVAFLAKEIK